MAKGLGFRGLWITNCILIASAVTAGVIKNHTILPGHKFFATLPEYEQTDYLTFELARGYTSKSPASSELDRLAEDMIVFPDALDIAEDLVKKFKTLQVPENFTENLFNFVQTEFNLDEKNIRTLILSRSICFENGICIDMNDLGAFCCPF